MWSKRPGPSHLENGTSSQGSSQKILLTHCEPPVSLIHDFFKDLDSSWTLIAAEKIRLPIIGATALLLQTDYERRTKDGDVLETAAIDDELQSRLLTLAGKDSKLHKRNGIYLEVVPAGLPILPQSPHWIPIVGLTSLLTHFQIDALHVVDVVISKLKRFHANDQQDIEAMIDRSLVPHDMSASVRARLLELSRKNGEQFNFLLTRYALERLLYRLGSTNREGFVLKGAMLFAL